MADDEMYLDNLKEFVIDEERIVTYKWLSRTLSVNVNQAKQMLYAFIQQQQQADCLSIIYTVGGLIKDKNGNLIQKYLFSHEEDLKDIKQCYDKITSIHVYSVQKTKPKDSNVLYLADYDLQKQNLNSPNRWSNITFKSVTKKNTELREETVAKNESRNGETKKPISNGFQKPAQNKVQVKPTSGPSTSAKHSKSKPSMKKGDVASFFARQAANKNKENVKSVNTKGEKQEKKEQEKKEGAMEKEQNKSDSTSCNKNEKNEKNDVKVEQESAKKVKEKDGETKEKEDELKTMVVDQPDEDFQTKTSSPKQGEKKSRKTQKQNKNEKENQEEKETKSKKRKTLPKEENEESQGKTKTQRKKRKRVKNFSDTSSEEEDNSVNTKQSNSDSTPIPDQQPQDNKPAEVQKIRRRKRVLKSKMHLNDEGYMVTEKVYQSESASSEEEQKQPTTKVETNKPALKDSIQPPKKKPATKQSSLTSFFKRT